LDVFGFVASDYFMNRHHQSDGKQNYFNYREVHFRFFSVPQYYKKIRFTLLDKSYFSIDDILVLFPVSVS
jgi:hypothetical protein